MVIELGHLALIVALTFSILLGTVPLVGYYRNNLTLQSYAKPLAILLWWSVLISVLALLIGLVQDDFSVKYIAENSNSKLPLGYKISALWGAHEGSLMLWLFIFCTYSASVALFSNYLPKDISSTTLGVLGAVATGFISFVLFTSNPFIRLLPYPPIDGNDLNPLLQDFGLIIHPPMLYIGYVGFAVCFAFALSALIVKRFDRLWAKWVRMYATISWTFLTLGITLGSWWAYYELGWGGWWFWDPVENASLMPWLLGTALIHSLIVTEKRQLFQAWSILLAIFSFSLSLLGTFLVRSGVLTSVHAFANDPTRGVYILVFLFVVVGVALTLFALRANEIKSNTKISGFSREVLLLVNNLLLVVVAATVLLGTLYPLIIESLGFGKLSVGPPYFNTVITPIGLVLMLAMGYGPVSRWKKTKLASLKKVSVWMLAAIVIFCALNFFIAAQHYALVFITLAGAAIVIAGVLYDLFTMSKQSLKNIFKQPIGYYGMTMAHIGLAVTMIGVALTSHYSIEKDVRIKEGETVIVHGMPVTLQTIKGLDGPNYHGVKAHFEVNENENIKSLYPEKRIYQVQNMPMTETAIDVGFFRDIYIALGEPIDDESWAVRIYYKPFVRWLWLGGLMMMLGGIFAFTDKRLRWQKETMEPSQSLN